MSKKINLKSILGKFLGVRGFDGFGSGAFGAPRGTYPNGTKRTHQGVDLIVEKGNYVYSPLDGIFNRVAIPYANDSKYKGFEVIGEGKHDGYTSKVFYCIPGQSMKKGVKVKAGKTIIATAQSLQEKYGSRMTDHIHIEIRKNGVLINPEEFI